MNKSCRKALIKQLYYNKKLKQNSKYQKNCNFSNLNKNDPDQNQF